ncbi:MAG: hypothetical protein LBL90_10230, partial [Prevotellaceae bacterium]|nr:hypothetical protein [Prevotellaceae bacterium]
INGPYINIDEATNLLLSPIQMGANLTQTSYYRRQVTDACSTAHSDTITITVYSNLVAGTIGSNQIICYNTAPAALSEITAVAGGDGTYDYQWQKADNINGPYDNIDGATNPLELSPAQMGGNLTQTSYYRRQVSDACGTSYSDTVTITVRKRIVYPDIRILACADHVINLTKYIDIEDFQSIKWFPSSEFSNLGDNNGTLINASQFMPENTYRFTYEVTNSCGTSSGVLYLTVIKDNSVTPFVTEVRVCYEQVSELLLNTMLGIEVEGSWSFSPTVASSHLTIISTGQHTGAAIFDIEGAWNNNSIPLNGNGEKEITVTYTTLGNSCTSGKSYTLKIIITDILP